MSESKETADILRDILAQLRVHRAQSIANDKNVADLVNAIVLSANIDFDALRYWYETMRSSAESNTVELQDEKMTKETLVIIEKLRDIAIAVK